MWKANIEKKFQLIILNKFIRLISSAKSRYISCTQYPILHFLGSILHVLHHHVLHKTQVNSLRKEELLVDAPHKVVEKEWMFNGMYSLTYLYELEYFMKSQYWKKVSANDFK